MHNLTFTNEYGVTLDLLGNKDKFIIYQVDGLNSADAVIAKSDVVSRAGTRIESITLSARTIVIYAVVRTPVETNKKVITDVFKTGLYGDLTIQNSIKTVSINGVVEKIETEADGAVERIKITLYCPDPYFKGEYKHYQFMGDAEISITNNGDAETWLLLELRSEIYLSNYPDISLTNANGTLSFKDLWLPSGPSYLTIDTKNKTITNSAYDNPYTAWQHGNVWLTIPKGTSTMTVDCSTSVIEGHIRFYELHKGV